MFDSLGLSPTLVETPRTTEVATLAVELLAYPAAIPTLVALELRRPDELRHELITLALARVVEVDPACRAAFEALTVLALDRGDRVAARDWAQRGLTHHPHALLLANVQAAVVEPITPAVAGRITPSRERAA